MDSAVGSNRTQCNAVVVSNVSWLSFVTTPLRLGDGLDEIRGQTLRDFLIALVFLAARSA